MAKRYKEHPYAAFFPKMEGDELAEFQKSLKSTGGNQVPSLVWAGQVLDGRHRNEETGEGDTKHLTMEWRPKSRDPIDQQFEILDLVESRNLFRRHLTSSQRAHAVELIEKERRRLHQLQGVGGETAQTTIRTYDDGNVENISKSPQKEGGKKVSTPATTGEKAKKSKASKPTQRAAKKVVEHGTEKLNGAVSSGAVSATDAAAITDKPPEVQDAAVDAVKAGTHKTVAAAVKDAANPFDEPLALCLVVMEHFVPKMQEHAIAIQRALGSGAAPFTSGKIANLASKIFEEFKSVKPVLQNAQKKFKCNSAK